MAKKGSVLVIDDEEIMRDVLSTLLIAAGYRVDLAKTGEEGLEAYTRRTYDVVLLDVTMPGIGGINALEELLKLDAEAVVIIITAYATFETAVTAWEKGAFCCLRKPFLNEQVTDMVSAAIKRRRKDEERQTLRRAMVRAADRGSIIGRSEAMEKIFRLVDQVAPARSTALISGESGTGKELIAKAIHQLSPRSNKPFVTVNSSNIPAELLESELFGHTKGAFTGAVAAKKGLFEIADGGTIFLDEIGDIPQETQAKLLRVIQEREFTPLGDTAPRRVDVRIVAATNVDLREAVRVGTFREDLYYRLSVVPIEMPPLRERREDILSLAQHFIRKFNEENTRHISETIPPDVLGLLEAYNWPGNVRELENSIERAVIIAPGSELSSETLRAEIVNPKGMNEASERNNYTFDPDFDRGINFYNEVHRFEVSLIRRALEHTGGQQSRAARLLGMNATTLNSKIKNYNIQARL